MPYCQNCGSFIPEDAKFCPSCGASFGAPASSTQDLGGAQAQAEPAAPQTGWYQAAPQETVAVPVAGKPAIGGIVSFYKKALSVLLQKPIKLWGLSLLYMFIAALIASLGSFVPIITIPIVLLLSLGFTGVLLKGYHEEEVKAEDLFTSFRKDVILRDGAGMCWKELWTLIWSFVPVMNIIKYYAYSFTPYILQTDKEIGATEALKKSMRMTDGYKGKLFGADLLAGVGVIVVLLVLALLARIPYIGFLFGIALFLFYLAVCLFLPLFLGLVRTAFFEEISSVHKD